MQFKDISAQAVFMGCLTAFTGFASSFPVVIHGLIGAGATPEQAASGLAALAIAMGLCTIVLSAPFRLPVSVAWSTPGAALLATTGVAEGGFSVAVGGFVICAVGFIIAGLWRPLGRAVAGIPSPLANALLAGVLLQLCLAPFMAIAFDPLLGLPILLAWIVVGAFNRLLAVPAALLAFVVVVALGVEIPDGGLAGVAEAVRVPVDFVAPEFTLASLVNIAVPLFIVTMASQNIPGIAVMTSNGYAARPGLWFSTTGLFSLASAPFGGHAVNLAAITAAMCAGEDAHADRSRRYWAAVISGTGYIVLGLFAGVVTAFVALAPTILIQAVAGLALVGAFATASVAAFSDAEAREAAAVTLLASASGITVFGVSGAFYGLVAGIIILSAKRAWVRRKELDAEQSSDSS